MCSRAPLAFSVAVDYGFNLKIFSNTYNKRALRVVSLCRSVSKGRMVFLKDPQSHAAERRAGAETKQRGMTAPDVVYAGPVDLREGG